MQSFFNRETGDKEYFFEQEEVFEALREWCTKKGIDLVDKQYLHWFDTFDGSKYADELGIKVKFNFKYKEDKNAPST